MAENPEQIREDLRTPVERTVARSFVAPESVTGQPLSRRARQTRRTVEAYLKAGVIPRYMQRLKEIEREKRDHRARLERAYRVLREACGDDAAEFARRWRAVARSWGFDHVNELIRQHNDWYPIETNLPMDPRTRDYVRIRGRSYRRAELGPEWVLEQFPAAPTGSAPPKA
jgi:hypothetical protein